MGCDIHVYVEYTTKINNITDNVNTKKYWRNFGGHFNPGRNYPIFGFMSKGVRGYCDASAFELKGVPDDIASSTFEDYYMYVIDDDDGDFESCISLSTANKWVSAYECKALYDNNSEITHIATPDWHSGSTLTTEEFKIVLDKFDSNIYEYEAILSSMISLESNGNEARIVFWFDN